MDKAANTVVKFDPDGYVVMNLGRREEGSTRLRLNWPEGCYAHALKLWVMLRLGDWLDAT